MLIKQVCLNLNRLDTWQQPVPAYRPASRVNQKAETKRVQQCTYTAQGCLYISCNVCSHLYTVHQQYRSWHTCYVHVYKMQNVIILVQTCTYTSERCTYMFIPPNISTCMYHVHTLYVHVYTFSEMYVHVYTVLEMYEHVCTMYVIGKF